MAARLGDRDEQLGACGVQVMGAAGHSPVSAPGGGRGGRQRQEGRGERGWRGGRQRRGGRGGGDEGWEEGERDKGEEGEAAAAFQAPYGRQQGEQRAESTLLWVPAPLLLPARLPSQHRARALSHPHVSTVWQPPELSAHPQRFPPAPHLPWEKEGGFGVFLGSLCAPSAWSKARPQLFALGQTWAQQDQEGPLITPGPP